MPLALYDYYVLKIDVQFGWVEALIGRFFSFFIFYAVAGTLVVIIVAFTRRKKPECIRMKYILVGVQVSAFQANQLNHLRLFRTLFSMAASKSYRNSHLFRFENSICHLENCNKIMVQWRHSTLPKTYIHEMQIECFFPVSPFPFVVSRLSS